MSNKESWHKVPFHCHKKKKKLQTQARQLGRSSFSNGKQYDILGFGMQFLLALFQLSQTCTKSAFMRHWFARMFPTRCPAESSVM